MNRIPGSRAKRFAVWCMTLLLAMGGMALAETKIELKTDEWVWEPGSVVAIQGSIASDTDAEDVTLTLAVETGMEESGEALFTVVDEKKLKVRKRAAETTVDLSAGQEMTFEAEWYLPEEVEGDIPEVKITLSAADADGNSLGETAIEAKNESASPMSGSSLERMVDLAILILAIASAVIWAAAIARHLVLNRKRKEAV